MTTPVPDEIDGAGFEERLLQCSDSLRAVVAYLRTSAQHAGVDVRQRRFRHPEPNTGWGVTYYVGNTPFLEIHPKLRAEHVGVLSRGADAGAILAAGFEPSEQHGWFWIRDMSEAVRFVRWILQSHDQRFGHSG